MINLDVNQSPNRDELYNLFQRAFSEIDSSSSGYFVDNPSMNQDNLADWFDFTEFIKYLSYGKLIEARDNDGLLIGAAFIGKQHPLTWPDGKKCELFIIGLLPGHEHKGLGSQILVFCQEQAKAMGAKSIIVNAHSEQPHLHKFYQKNMYHNIGTLKNYYANGDAVFFQKNLL